MNQSISIEEGLSFFLLEDEGILFSESDQAIFAFNTPAAFIWCCLEENMSAQEISAAFSASFDVSPEEAARTTSDLLSRWNDLGYIHGALSIAHSEVDWTTAVARLMHSPPLRDEFRRSPAAVARRLNLRPDDRAPFISLRPDAVDQEAQHLADRKSIRPFDHILKSGPLLLWSTPDGEAGQTILDAALKARARYCGKMRPAHCYRLLSATFSIRCSSAAQEARVHPALAHLEVPAAEPDTALEILETRSGHVLVEGIAPLAYSPRLERITPRLKSELLRLALQQHRYFLELHAGVVSNGQKCLLLPAAPGSGKSTLTAALVAAGFQYFSDEVALLEEPNLDIRPVPISVSVKSGAFNILTPLHPGLARSAEHTREDFETVRYLSPPAAALRYDPNRTYPAGWIVFPRYSPGVSTELRPIRRADALARMMREILVVAKPLDRRAVRSLVDWIRRVECYELPNSSLDRSVELVSSLLA